jgi:hypothetical protein
MTMPLTPGRYGTVDGTSTVKTITCRVRVHDFLSCNTELANKYCSVTKIATKHEQQKITFITHVT